MNRRCSGPQLILTRSPTEVSDECPDYSVSDPSSRSQAPVESESLPEICDPVPDAEGGVLSEEGNDVPKSLGANTRSSASSRPARWQEEDGGTSDESGPLPVPKSAREVSGQRHHRWRMLIDHLMCRDGKLKELLLERRAVRTLAARRFYQTALETFLKCVKERVLPLIEDVEIDGALVAYLSIALPREFPITMVRSFLLP